MITKTLSAPVTICLGITNKCNLSCKHCLASNTRYEHEFTTDELFDIICQIEKLKIFNIGIFGGEPLIRKDFFIIAERLSKSGLNLYLNTNGTLITKAIAKRLSQYPIRVYTVSLDGSCDKVQDPFRGKGSFNKNISGIENLIREKCKVIISTIITKFNYNDAENIASLGKRLGAQEVRLNEVMFVGNAACYHQELQVPLKERLKLLERLDGLRNKFGNFVTGSAATKFQLIKNTAFSPNRAFPLQVDSCGAATLRCAIRPDGWVTPCEILWDVKAGNLKEKTLGEIWRDSPVMQEFRRTVEINEDEIPGCRGCQYLQICYNGHRCYPYYYPGARFERREFYCLREDATAKSKE